MLLIQLCQSADPGTDDNGYAIAIFQRNGQPRMFAGRDCRGKCKLGKPIQSFDFLAVDIVARIDAETLAANL